MNNQKVTVFRQKNKVGPTVAVIAACLVLSPMLSTGVFLPQVLTTVPVLLLAMLGYVGPVSMAVCSGILAALCSALFGVWGGVSAMLLIVPTVIVSGVMLEREHPFWESVAASGVTMFASMGVVVGLMSLLAGSDVVSALTQIMREMLDAYSGFGDMLLTVMMQLGVLSAPEGVELGGMTALDPQVRGQLIDSLVLLMDSMLRLELPMQMATGSVTAGLLGQAVLRKGVIAGGQKTAYPPLKTWRVPKGWGRILGGTLAVLYLLAMLVPQSMNTMFYVFSGVFNKVFALQGIAAVCYLLDKRGKSAVWQGVVFVAGYFFLGSFAVMVGILDQAADFSHRREELDKEENPFDPRHGA
ncbi:MAG: DUF2232 domain-containing protein [Candidatus Ventricola sp.]